jgi:pyrroloquinoline quinone biosynthesis protein B
MNNDSCVVTVLGTAQDAGVPQLGCNCKTCKKAMNNIALRRLVTSIGIINPLSGNCYIIDSTMNFPEQYGWFRKYKSTNIHYDESKNNKQNESQFDLDGLFLTHAHMGHYLGLTHLGKEACAAHNVPVYATASMSGFLSNNQPFKDLILNKNIQIAQITPNKECTIEPNLIITPFSVPHRSEYSDTVGFLIKGPEKQLIYTPDFDELTDELITRISNADIAIIDGTFYSRDELSGSRNFEEVPHPPILETIQQLQSYAKNTSIFFTHFNHTNPILVDDSKELINIKNNGFNIVSRGQVFKI